MKPCECGCGEAVTEGRRFRRGHNAKTHSVPITAERLFARRHIDPATGCWIWTGGDRTRQGYGLLHVSSRPRRRVYVHRIAIELFRGIAPEGWLVCHACDNPACFNPWHLFLGDRRSNSVDMAAKGRTVSGTIPEVVAAEICARAEAGERHRALAAEFGISVGHVSYLRHRAG
jgi:hypothetical protein